MNKKLLIFTQNYVQGGGYKFMLDIISALEEDYTNTVILTNKSGVFYDKGLVDKKSVSFHNVLLIHKLRFAEYIPDRLRKNRIVSKFLGFCLLVVEPVVALYHGMYFLLLLIKIKPTKIIVCNGGYPAATSCLVFVIIARLLRHKVIMTIVSTPSRRRKIVGLVELLVDKLVWRACNLVVVNCKAIETDLHRLRSLPVAKSRIAYNGIKDQQYFSTNNAGLGNIQQKIVIGFVSRVEKAKGVFLLLEVFSRLNSIQENVELRIYGEGSDLPKLSRAIDVLGLGNKVHLMGRYSGDVSEILGAMDIFVLPSEWEGLPYSIIEAMRSGLAIIASRIGGIPEALTNNHSGILIQPNSSEELSNALRLLIADKDLLNRLGLNARIAFLEKFEFSKTQANLRLTLNQ